MLVTTCIPFRPDRDLSWVFQQNWAEAECIIIAEQSDWQQVEEFARTLMQYCTDVRLIAETNTDCWENDAMQQATGDFLVFLQPYQTWGADFIQQIKNQLKAYFVDPHLPTRASVSAERDVHFSQLLVYGMGYVETKNASPFCADVYPFLHKKPSIIRNFNRPELFVSCLCFAWSRTLITQNNLKFNQEITSAIMRHAVFGIDMLAAMYTLNHGFEPEFIGAPVSLTAPLNTFSSPTDLVVYQDHVRSKWQLWEQRAWSKLNLLSKWSRIRERMGE